MIKIRGIVLYNIRYKETSAIVYLLTKEGIISYRVLGAFRKKSKVLGATFPLSLTDVNLSNASFPSLNNYSVIDGFLEIKNSLHKTIFAESLVDLTKKIKESVYYERVYLFFLRSLEYIRSTTNYYLIVSIYYLKMTRIFGINPSFDTEAFSNDKKSGLLPLKHIVLIKSLYYEPDFVLIKKYENKDFRGIFYSIVNYYSYLLDFRFTNLKNIKAIEKR